MALVMVQVFICQCKGVKNLDDKEVIVAPDFMHHRVSNKQFFWFQGRQLGRPASLLVAVDLGPSSQYKLCRLL